MGFWSRLFGRKKRKPVLPKTSRAHERLARLKGVPVRYLEDMYGDEELLEQLLVLGLILCDGDEPYYCDDPNFDDSALFLDDGVEEGCGSCCSSCFSDCQDKEAAEEPTRDYEPATAPEPEAPVESDWRDSTPDPAPVESDWRSSSSYDSGSSSSSWSSSDSSSSWGGSDSGGGGGGCDD